MKGISAKKVGSTPIDVAESARALGVWRPAAGPDRLPLRKYFLTSDNCAVPPDMVTEIRSFWPEYVPVYLKAWYFTPANTEIVVEYHVLGSCHPEGRDQGALHFESVPYGMRFRADRVYELKTLAVPWPKETVEHRLCMPPAPFFITRPFIRKMRYIRKLEDTTNVGDRNHALMSAEDEANRQELQKAMDEARYRARHNWRQIKNAFEQGRIAAPVKDPAPFVHVQGFDAAKAAEPSKN